MASLKVPGESSFIDILLTALANKYVGENPGVFKDEDSCLVMGYGLVMLSADISNDQIKNKTTREQFCKNLVGMANIETLLTFYEYICQEWYTLS